VIHVGSRVATLAGAGEVLVTAAVPGEWNILALSCN
jgi:hypothetical protein